MYSNYSPTDSSTGYIHSNTTINIGKQNQITEQ